MFAVIIAASDANQEVAASATNIATDIIFGIKTAAAIFPTIVAREPFATAVLAFKGTEIATTTSRTDLVIGVCFE